MRLARFLDRMETVVKIAALRAVWVQILLIEGGGLEVLLYRINQV